MTSFILLLGASWNQVPWSGPGVGHAENGDSEEATGGRELRGFAAGSYIADPRKTGVQVSVKMVRIQFIILLVQSYFYFHQ